MVCKGFDADEAARQAERALSEIQVVVAWLANYRDGPQSFIGVSVEQHFLFIVAGGVRYYLSVLLITIWSRTVSTTLSCSSVVSRFRV